MEAIWRRIQRAIPSRTQAAEIKRSNIQARGNIATIGDISSQSIEDGLSIANIEIETDAPVVGVTPVGASGPLTGELFFPNSRAPLRLFAFLPKGTLRIGLRNATNWALPIGVGNVSLSYARFADAEHLISPQMAEVIRRVPKQVFIHTLGKTGSVALQHTLRPVQNVLCARDHFVNMPVIDPNPGSLAAGILRTLNSQSLVSRRITMHLVEQAKRKPESMDVICGVRRSEFQATAALFQNSGALFEELDFSPDTVLQHLHARCRSSFAFYAWWWTEEFCSTHGFSVDELLQGMQRQQHSWTFTAPSGVRFRFYRIEDSDAAMRECLLPYAKFASNPHSFPEQIIRANVGADKSYADLYRATRASLDTAAIRAMRPPVLQRVEEAFYGKDR